MKVSIKLYASFGCFLPPGARNNRVEVDLASGTTVHQALERFSVPLQEAHLVVVNGVFICASERDAYLLKEGDTLAVWPAVAGG
ncbi:sulfur carrier protein ThiS [Aestuariirhabdus litorea]|uniref:MoaD/ThiS family protein n=1 Tax=Aestuariirhabdus litorea TaxID=2528527 RepID=A0A3P3VPW7_9GAMM|nr:MoaD/ThiS family protein [Aestuariirhabdus litorea]RRJ84775.1 MoaD/ThiS family protein [Aestuariirhabdus litorea]RWW97999.1 MoaD/ThiS family protein [Endozoicomonadaceae bacterium GTF-13]